MANVQIDNGDFTRIANEILEQIAKAKLNGTQYAVVMTVWRFTYGFQRTSRGMSLGFIEKATGINKKQVGRELTKLVDRKIIVVEEEAGFNKSQVLRFNKDYDQWVSAKTLTGSELVEETVSELVDTPVSGLVDQERNSIKKITKEKNPPIIPPKKPAKKKYGEFQNVKLTDEEYSRLCTEKGQAPTDEAIKFLDEYIEEKGYKSKSHNLAIRRWVFDAIEKRVNKSPPVVKRRMDKFKDIVL